MENIFDTLFSSLLVFDSIYLDIFLENCYIK